MTGDWGLLLGWDIVIGPWFVFSAFWSCLAEVAIWFGCDGGVLFVSGGCCTLFGITSVEMLTCALFAAPCY